MNFIPKPTCPNCHHHFKESQLIKKPYDQSLKWYQISPEPTLHCPHCQIQLKRTLKKSYFSRAGLIVFVVIVLTFLGNGEFLPTMVAFAFQMVCIVSLLICSKKYATWQIVNDGL